MFLDGKWYILAAKEGIFNMNDPVDRLDVSILQNNLLKPILGIDDVRTNQELISLVELEDLENLKEELIKV